MGFNIHAATRATDGKLYDLPDTSWPEPGWDYVRYGWDYEYVCDLGRDMLSKWEMIFWDSDDGEGCNEECWRPDDQQRKALRAKYPENPRLQRLMDLLDSDPNMVIYIS